MECFGAHEILESVHIEKVVRIKLNTEHSSLFENITAMQLMNLIIMNQNNRLSYGKQQADYSILFHINYAIERVEAHKVYE